MGLGTVLNRLLRVNAAVPYSLTLPAADAAGVLQSDGAGVLSLSKNPTLGSPIIDTLINLTGGAVRFPAAQVASAGANDLDDYEEGMWTPADGSGAGLGITVNSAIYIKIGQFVIAWFDITYPATANGNSSKISGLPFTANAAGGNGFGGLVHVSTMATNPVFANLQSSNTTFSFNTTANTALTNANLSNTTNRGCVMCRASA